MHIVVDGQLVDPQAASISVLDRGLLYGDGVFEVLRTWGGRAVDLDAHLDRLLDSCAALRIAVDRPGLAASAALGLRAAGAGEHRLRIVVTRGQGSLATPLAEVKGGRSIVIVEPLGTLPTEMSLAIVDWPMPSRTSRGHKTLAYLDHVIARELARDAGADDAVRLLGSGVVEGGTCNVFAVIGQTVHVADAGGVLPGIVRARVEELCRRADIPVVVGPIAIDAFCAADELFATSSVRGVVPVTRVGERTLPRGMLTNRIALAYVDEMTARSVI